LFYDFPGQAGSYEEQDAFMLGRDLLVAPVVERGAISRPVWLPETEGGWYRIGTGEPYPAGRSEVPAPLGAAPAFMRAGSILPLGPSPSWTEGPLTLRLFPLPGAKGQLELFDDDGESFADPSGPPSLLHVETQWNSEDPLTPALSPRREGVSGVPSPLGEKDRMRGSSPPIVRIARSGSHRMRWPEILFEDASGAPLSVTLGQAEGGATVNQIRLSNPVD
jgi:alpha-glucosidase